MATNSHIKQHFIPVCYLRGFSNNDKNLYVYDKRLTKVFCKAFEHVGYEEHFYRIDRKFLKDKNVDENYYETDFFAKNIESEYNRILKDLQKRANAWLTSRKNEFAFSSVADSDHFAAYIGIQHLRLPGIREMYYNSYRKGQDKRLEILKGMIGHIHPELKGAGKNITIDHDERFGAALHSFLYSDKKIVDATQDKLLRKSWAFFVSPENVLFTSDNPIVVINRLKLKAVPGDFTMPGAQIIFPISSNILLSMWDDDCFDHSKHIKNGFNLMGAQEARTNNVYQYANAIRQIYQAGNDFSIAEEFLADNNGQHVWYPQPMIEVHGG